MKTAFGSLTAILLGGVIAGCEPSQGGQLCDDINFEAAAGCTIICPWRRATSCNAVAADDCLQRVMNAHDAGATCGQIQTIVSDVCRPECS